MGSICSRACVRGFVGQDDEDDPCVGVCCAAGFIAGVSTVGMVGLCDALVLR